jgi:hypothetical protein
MYPEWATHAMLGFHSETECIEHGIIQKNLMGEKA